MSKQITVAKILTEFLERKKELNPGYSLRAFSRDLNLSPSFVSRICSGEKSISAKHAKRAFKILDIDLESQMQINRLILEERLGGDHAQLVGVKKNPAHLKYKSLSKRKLSVLKEWYFIPVLELLTISSFQESAQSVAQKLKITVSQVQQSLDVLSQLGIIKKSGDAYVRIEHKMRLSSAGTQPEIRNYHSMMISRATDELKKTDDHSFSLRLITGITFGANLEKLEQAKAILNQAMHKASEVLGADPCSEVYQINLQIFPLTTPSK